MEEDDDDFYGRGGISEPSQQELLGDAEEAEEAEAKEEPMGVSEAEDEDEEDDIQFTLDKPQGAKDDKPGRLSAKPTPSHDRTASQDVKPAMGSTPRTRQEQPRAGSTAPPSHGPAASKGTLTVNGKEGKDYPSVRTSKLDLDSVPNWPAVNGPKPLTHLDIDADLVENSKPWRLPGTDQTDFFNYGFDEYTWTQYCIKQQSMSGQIQQMRDADAQMKAMLGMGGGPGGPPGMPPAMPPGMPPGMPGMDGMNPDMMMQMMQQQGMNPNNMDFGQFAQMMAGMPPGMQPPGMQGPPGPSQGGFGQGGGFAGQGQQGSASPMPGGGQGFQPPQGSGGGQGGEMNMEGYSPQQVAIMQAGGGGGGRGGRGRKGRW